MEVAEKESPLEGENLIPIELDVLIYMNNHSHPYKFYREIRTQIKQERKNYYRMKVDRAIDHLINKNWIIRLKTCPNCDKVYRSKIPPICNLCNFVIFPSLTGVTKAQKWPKYILTLNNEQKSRISELLKSLKMKLDKFKE